MYAALALVVGLALTGAACVTGLKGKWGLLVAGFFLTPIFWVVGAIRLAKPNSVWARGRYGPEKQRRASMRFAEAQGKDVDDAYGRIKAAKKRRDIPALLAELRNPLEGSGLTVRSKAARTLGKLRASEAAEPISGLVSDPNDWVRTSAVVALGDIGNPIAVPALVAALQDPKIGVRRATTGALAKIGDRQATGPLIECLTSDDLWLRRAAADALARIGDRRAIPALEDAMKRERFYRRRYLYRAKRALDRSNSHK